MNKTEKNRFVLMAFSLSIFFLSSSLCSKHLVVNDRRIPQLLFCMGTFNFGLALYKWIDED